MQPRDLFDHIDLALHVKAPTRNLHPKLRVGLSLRDQRETQFLQDPEDLTHLQIRAQDAPHLGNSQHHRCLVHLLRYHVNRVANQFAAARFKNQRRHQVARQNRRLKIRSALESVRCVGVNPVPPRHLPHDPRVPPRRFNQNIPRLVGNHRVEPAHDPCKPHGLLRVGDHQIFGSKRAFYTVQCLQLLSVLSFSNDELATLKQVHIENMRWLAHLPQNVVGSIDGIADRPLVKQLQPPRNLLRRSLDGRSTYNSRREARTKLRLFDDDGERHAREGHDFSRATRVQKRRVFSR